MPEMPILSSGELHVARVDEPSEIETAARYWPSGFDAFLGDGNVAHLEPFEGVEIAGLPLETDPDAIERWYDDNGALDFTEYYRA